MALQFDIDFLRFFSIAEIDTDDGPDYTFIARR